MQSVESPEFAAHSRTLLAEASDALQRGELPLAEEMGWEAVSRMALALAVSRGQHDIIHAMVRVMQRLADRTGDRPLIDHFLGALHLQINYVPGGLPPQEVEFCLERAAGFVEHVEALLKER